MKEKQVGTAEKGKPETKKILWDIVIAAVGVLLVAGLGMLFSSFHREWYHALNRPVFDPPDIVFGIVWGVLYLLAAASLALYLIGGAQKRTVWLYIANGILNIFWTLFFFTAKSPALAFVVILANAFAALLLLKNLFAENKLSAWFTVPYTLWIIFAIVLNYSIIMLN